eukprot:2499117-Pleurochrysis_carterae.AAC.1
MACLALVIGVREYMSAHARRLHAHNNRSRRHAGVRVATREPRTVHARASALPPPSPASL